MGDLNVYRLNAGQLRSFVAQLLGDVRALEGMLEAGVIESGRKRVGCEQEMFLVDRALRPLPAVMEFLEAVDDPAFTTELGRFNLEVNLDSVDFGDDCLSRLELDLRSKIARARKIVAGLGGEVVVTGMLPTLRKSDLTLDNLTPMTRYRALNESMGELRGGEYEFRLRGLDELILKQDSVMLESCCASFQLHYQVDPDRFVELYNLAQAVTAPLLAVSVNSPVLFGRRLWAESRIPLFQQAIDTRRATASLRERSPRVRFGERWLEHSPVELFREDIARFRVLLGTEVEEDAVETFRLGGTPGLRALQVHNGTIYRWNRACYGINEGMPTLRIENRVLPAGPTLTDEIANAALFFGMMEGVPHLYPDITRVLDFDQAQFNFMSAAELGLDTQFTWSDGVTVPARELLEKELIPAAKAGLLAAGLASGDIEHYMGIVEERVRVGQTGARWALTSMSGMKGESRDTALTALTAAIIDRQRKELPGHEWKPAQIEEGRTMQWQGFRIEEAMSTDLFTIHPDEPIDLVTHLMEWKRVRHVPVEDEAGRVVGLVSFFDVIAHLNRPDPSQDRPVAVRSVMNPHPATVQPRTPLLAGVSLMRKEESDCLLVVQDDRLVGIVTERDILSLAADLLASGPIQEARQSDEP